MGITLQPQERNRLINLIGKGLRTIGVAIPVKAGHLITAGDVEGHEFHGNQWTQPGEGMTVKEMRKRLIKERGLSRDQANAHIKDQTGSEAKDNYFHKHHIVEKVRTSPTSGIIEKTASQKAHEAFTSGKYGKTYGLETKPSEQDINHGGYSKRGRPNEEFWNDWNKDKEGMKQRGWSVTKDYGQFDIKHTVPISHINASGFYKIKTITAVELSEDKWSTPNQKHAAAVVLRSIRLQAVGNWLVSKDVERLDELKAFLCKVIKANNPTGAGSRIQQRKRVKGIFAISEPEIKEVFESMAKDADARQDQLAQTLHDSNTQRLLAHHGVKAAKSGADAGDVLVLGAPLREHYEKMGSDLAFRFRTLIRSGVSQGETAEQLCDRLDGSAAASPVNANEIVPRGTIQAAEVGHPFYGNQWTSESFEAATVPLREKKLIGDEVAFLKNDGTVQRGYLKFRHTKDEEISKGEISKAPSYQQRSYFGGLSKREWRNAVQRKAEYEVEHADIKNGVLARTGEITVLHNSKIRMPTHGFQQKEFRTNASGFYSNNEALTATDPTPEQAAAVDKRLSVGVKIFDGTENSIAKVIQAALTALANAADEAALDDEDGAETDKRMGYQWVAVLDANTCEACEFYDGQKWDNEFEPANDDSQEYPGDPPVHFNCRCSTIPVDLDAEEPAEKVSFKDYLSQFSREEKEQAFGKLNYQRWQKGELSDANLSSQKDNMMTLEAFKEAEK